MKEKVETWIEKLGLSGKDAKFLRKYAEFMENAEALDIIRCMLSSTCPYKKSFEVVKRHIGTTTSEYVPLKSEED